MKQVAKSLVVVGAMLAAGSVVADMDMDFKPFIGVDYLHAWMPGKGVLTNTNVNAKDAFRQTFPGATVYVGAKFTENFGIELGGNWSSTQSRTSSGATTAAVGALPANTGFTYVNKTRRDSYHADLVGFLPIDCWELFGSLGYGSVRLRISDQTLTATVAANQAALNARSPLPLSTSRNGVLRLGVGASYMFTEIFGVRAKLGWEGTQNLRLRYSNNFAVDSKSFRNSTTLALGAFLRW